MDPILIIGGTNDKKLSVLCQMMFNDYNTVYLKFSISIIINKEFSKCTYFLFF